MTKHKKEDILNYLGVDRQSHNHRDGRHEKLLSGVGAFIGLVTGRKKKNNT